MTKTKQITPVELTATEMHKAGGGVGYLKIGDIKGESLPHSGASDSEWKYVTVRR